MSKHERGSDERIRRLLLAGKTAYPRDLDTQLRERISQLEREARPLLPSRSVPRWRWAAATAAAVLLAAAGLLWWPAGNRPGPGVASGSGAEGLRVAETAPLIQGPAAAMAAPHALPPQGAAAVPDSAPKIAARAVMKKGRSGPGAAAKGPVRLEFVVPERRITILWEQHSDFDLAALVAAR